jgi:hypothetical protein
MLTLGMVGQGVKTEKPKLKELTHVQLIVLLKEVCSLQVGSFSKTLSRSQLCCLAKHFVHNVFFDLIRPDRGEAVIDHRSTPFVAPFF